jgi:anti-sigma factor RsiW
VSGLERPIGEDDLAAHVDGRVPAGRQAALATYLAERPDQEAELRRDRETLMALRDRLAPIAGEPVPSRLRVAAIRAERRGRQRRRFGLALAAVLLLTVGGTAGWYGRDLVGGPRPLAGRAWAAIAEEALAAHRTYTVEVVHPVEVKAAEEAHLVQWLSKRLKRRLVIPDLEERFGLTLVGGRLLPAGRDVAALLMYADASGSRLTLYVRSGGARESALNFMREGEVSAFSWMDEGYGYVVSAAMDRDKLQSVAKAVLADVDLDAARRRRAL